jgi:hypothetical protein
MEIQSQSPRALVHELLKNSFNADVLDRQRLSRQFVARPSLRRASADSSYGTGPGCITFQKCAIAFSNMSRFVEEDL